MPGSTRRMRDALPLLPFVAVVTVFLIVPTVTVIVMAFFADGSFSLDRIAALFSGTALTALAKSIALSASTALIGAVLGAVLAWLIVSSPPASMLRRVPRLTKPRTTRMSRRRTAPRPCRLLG
jgi:putative spermidine/putrescine transport system permease protein